jgi:hypothetical protein
MRGTNEVASFGRCNEGPGQRIRRKRKRDCHRNFDKKKRTIEREKKRRTIDGQKAIEGGQWRPED